MLSLIAKAALSGGQSKPQTTEIPTDALPPSFEELSPDLRYKLLQRKQRGQWASNGLFAVLCASLLLPVALPQLNSAADSFISQAKGLKSKADTASEFINPDFSAPVQKGNSIASYWVTSGYGLRDTSNLPEGASADHKGVDLATPTGTKLRAIGDRGDTTTVHCRQDEAGGGKFAEFWTTAFPDLMFQALHLSECTTGIYESGSAFAKTGDTGIGAEHLDWRQRNRESREHQPPQKVYLLWALTGRKPDANFARIDILRNSIIGQESAGDARIVNKDSGALGLGQVMPENLAGEKRGWDHEAIGRDLSPDEFLNDSEAQIKIINHQMGRIYSEQKAAGHSDDEAVKRTAAAWYSGNPDKADDMAPQYWKGDPGKAYPSIADYSQQVLERTKSLQQNRLKQLDKR